MPRVTIDLMARETANNDPFYERLVREFYAESTRLHPKWRLIKALRWGVALLLLPDRFEDYFMRIEASARRNYKKALRHGCVCRRINYNDHLAEIAAIRASDTVRQGKMPAKILRGEVTPCRNPPARSALHDYPYFGVFKDDRLVAYAGLAVYGELAMIEHIYGHADYQDLGVTPMLVIEMAGAAMNDHPGVRHFGYGTFFGASRQMQRFKRKLGFMPHCVTWESGEMARPNTVQQKVFRRVSATCPKIPESVGMVAVIIDHPAETWRWRRELLPHFGIKGWLKILAKTATSQRSFYGVINNHALIHYGWLSFGFCRYYVVEAQAVVVGPIWTAPAARDTGAATFALQFVIGQMYMRSRSIVYIDTAFDNAPCLRVIEKCGFGPPVGMFVKKQ